MGFIVIIALANLGLGFAAAVLVERRRRNLLAEGIPPGIGGSSGAPVESPEKV
jgi:hypothetical protein